jgi:hypothetical protein
MTIELLINSIDRTDELLIESLKKQDNINEQRDILSFQLVNPSFTPVINQEVELDIDGTKEFGGVIVEVEKSIKHGQMKVYNVMCGDYAQFLNRKLVLERYDNKTIDYIIDDIVSTYASDFTITNVNCPIQIKSMVFNRTTMTEALDKMAKAVGYSWYVDYDKDIHFFERNQNPAPFIITDTNGNYLQNTLFIRDDISQIRNVVVIRGSEERAIERTETYIADGDQVMFPTANKFAEIPVVNIESTTMIVGTDYLTSEENADCFWSYGEKYIRFKDDTKPADGETVSFTGIPLFPIIVKVIHPVSIAEYGTYEFFKEDKSIKSREEALDYAQAQLSSYSDGIIEGGFETDQTGLRSGQIIRINSDLLGVNERFLIQRVHFRMLAKDKGIWTASLATLRTIGIIQVLQDLLRFREIREYDPDNLLTLLQPSDLVKITDSSIVPLATTSPPYQWVDDIGDQDNPGYWNFATWS